ncbi:MAG: hypothetical protein E6Q71_01285 [Pseudomonas sp.]|nr:MAG: hypothetical protein E6Q71_01285 [Pseudomonas sp.]
MRADWVAGWRGIRTTGRLEGLEGLTQSVQSLSNWDDLVKTGFEDIDPTGLLSGPYAKLRKR